MDAWSHRVGWADLAVVPLVVVLSIPPLLWFAYEWTVTVDSGRYLLDGWHLISGHGYTVLNGNPEIKRGPVLPGLLGFWMLIFGRDTESLAWAVRLLALLNPLLSYLLVRRLFGPFAGLLAAALVTLLSYTAINPDILNIDAVLLTMYLLSLLALVFAVRRGNVLLALVSGLLLGLAILTKETAFVNLPLGIVAVLLFGWNLRGAFWHYVGVALVCLPWWVWVWHASGEVYLVGRLPAELQVPAAAGAVVVLALVLAGYFSGLFERVLAHERLGRWLGWLAVTGWVVLLSGFLLSTGTNALADLSLSGLRVYVFEQLPASLAAWPLLLVAIGYVAFRATREPNWRFLAIVLLFQVPLVILITVERWDRRQFLSPQTLLLCALAGLVAVVCKAAIKREDRSWLKVSLAALLGCSLLAFALGEVGYLLTQHPENLSGGQRYAAQSAKMADWMASNTGRTRILTTRTQVHYTAFLNGDRSDVTGLKMDQSQCRQNPIRMKKCNNGNDSVSSIPPSAVWLYIDDKCDATSLSMSKLMRQSRREHAGYVLLTSKDKTVPGILKLAPHLQSSGAFRIVHREVAYDNIRGKDEGLILLERTGRNPRAIPAQMETQDVLRLVRCERSRGPGALRRIRSALPNGITLVPASSSGRANATLAARQNAEARQLISYIYSIEATTGRSL